MKEDVVTVANIVHTLCVELNAEATRNAFENRDMLMDVFARTDYPVDEKFDDAFKFDGTREGWRLADELLDISNGH